MKILETIKSYINYNKEDTEDTEPDELGIGALVTEDANRLYGNNKNQR